MQLNGEFGTWPNTLSCLTATKVNDVCRENPWEFLQFYKLEGAFDTVWTCTSSPVDAVLLRLNCYVGSVCAANEEESTSVAVAVSVKTNPRLLSQNEKLLHFFHISEKTKHISATSAANT